ncbi:MAG TPA: polymer-forming cytoskeletal protein [Acidobacteriota bacterium]|nr:polymer-forming cytoskeletal protein [Acidobacteriota bacterium]
MTHGVGWRAGATVGCALALALLCSSFARATEFRAEGAIRITEGEIRDDLFATGGDITVDVPVRGDILAFARTINIGERAEIDNSVIAAGQHVELGGRVRNSARLAGQYLTVRGHVERNLMGFGQNLIVTSGSYIEKDATVMAENVTVHGHIGGDVNGSCGTITIAGQVDGNIDIEAGTVVIQSTAIIGGQLKYRSTNDAKIDEAARILGGVERLDPKSLDEGYTFGCFVWDAWWFLATFVVGVILLIMFRPFVTQAVECMIGSSGKSVGLGLLFLVCLPVAAVALMLTIVGIPVGLLIILGWLILMYLSHVFVGLALGDMILGHRRASGSWGTFLAMFIGMAIVTLVVRVPYLGWVARLLVLATGFGGFLLTAYKYRTQKAAAGS